MYVKLEVIFKIPTTKELGTVLGGIVLLGFGTLYLAIEGTGSIINYYNNKNPLRIMLRDTNIEQGFVKPSQLELKLEDNNLNGSNDVYAIFNSKKYGMFDDDRTLKVRELKYEINPIYDNSIKKIIQFFYFEFYSKN